MNKLTIRLILAIVLILNASSLSPFQSIGKAAEGTSISGIIKSDTVWSKENSPYVLSGDVQIDYGAVLSIEPGTVVEGNGFSLQVWGELEAIGTKSTNILFNEVDILPGENVQEEPFFIHVKYSTLNRGSIYSPTGNAVYGTITLTDSELRETDYMHLWYPTSDAYIERNIFIKSGGISVGTSGDTKVFIRNNVFYQWNSPYEQYAIENWASYSNSETIVEYNSFLSTDRIALRLPKGYTGAKMTASNNYWGTLDPNLIDSMIYDKNDNLASADTIDYDPILVVPHENTPLADFELPHWSDRSISEKDIGTDYATFEWSAAYDNLGVTNYRIFQNGYLIDTVNSDITSYTAQGLKEASRYEFRVEAGDEAGNWTTDGPVLMVSTRDETKPNWPDSSLSSDYPTNTSIELTWKNATDNSWVDYYQIYQDSKLVGTAKTNRFLVTDLKPGNYYSFKVEAVDSASNVSTDGPVIQTKTSGVYTERLSGLTRYETAVEISKSGWDKADTVVLARGDSFPDALAGAPLAYKLDAPILLSEKDEINQATLKEIERLEATNIILLGGSSAISSMVEEALIEKDFNVERIHGKNRYETAVKIAEKLNSKTNKSVLVYGYNFPDALSSAAYAARNGYPILLTDRGSISQGTENYIENFSRQEVIAIGGSAVIQDSVLKSLSVSKKSRISGANRYDTAAQVLIKSGFPKEKTLVANGRNFADALTGSVLAAKQHSSLLLVDPNQVPKEFLEVKSQYNLTNFTILGGKAAVSNEVRTKLEE
ncbi:cell wall-binding repeat-containing protein [Rossellomorea vietnamensis]|uniref:cell wall-binding repeat-containing protein n=1 Tax=Rossellomorea vietnamensis TaxID=218284 RepID=UPI003CEC0E8C